MSAESASSPPSELSGRRARVQELRRQGLAARRGLRGSDRARAQARLDGHLASLLLPPGTTVGVTIADDGEPDLASLVQLHRSRGGQVALPVLADDPDDFSMRFRLWQADDELTPGRFGIPCPPEGPDRHVVPDVVLVPLVCFDPAGSRLGRGAGFYDRWMSANTTERIGVAFEVQRTALLDPEPHDVPLDAMVTDLGIRWFRPMVTS